MTVAEELMGRAIAAARKGIADGQTPFGCAISRGDQVLAVAHNTVWETTDVTAHAEINALREACRTSGQILLPGAIVATTCEPCPMCMAALHWARVDTVFYGATIADAQAAGFNELLLPARTVVEGGRSTVKLVSGVQSTACRALFTEWGESPRRRSY
jgi:guanine deaminase